MLCALRRRLLEALELALCDALGLGREALGGDAPLQLGEVVLVLVGVARGGRRAEAFAPCGAHAARPFAAGCARADNREGRRPALLLCELLELLPDRHELLQEGPLALPALLALFDTTLDPAGELERLVGAAEDLEPLVDALRGGEDAEEGDLVGVGEARGRVDGEGGDEGVEEGGRGRRREACDDGAQAADDRRGEGRRRRERLDQARRAVAQGGDERRVGGG